MVQLINSKKYRTMKKIIRWLAKVFNADITVTKYVTVTKEVEVPVDKVVEKYVSLGGVVDGDMTVIGDLIVNGRLECQGSLACLSSLSSNIPLELLKDKEIKRKEA